jgi:hypothetical protein
VICISANPYINSKLKVGGFEGKKHFDKIIDVWESEWDENYGTVFPNNVTRIAIKMINSSPDKKYIVHYLQPHAPYLSPKYQTHGFSKPDIEHNKVLIGLQGKKGSSLKEKMVNGIGYILFKLRLSSSAWDLRARLNMPPATPMDAFRRKWGVNGLRDAYGSNLKIVLEQVNELGHTILDEYPSLRIAITSDHGELLGENGNFSHHSGSSNPILVEVPFLRIISINTIKKRLKSGDRKEEAKIKTTIRDLKKKKKV